MSYYAKCKMQIEKFKILEERINFDFKPFIIAFSLILTFSLFIFHCLNKISSNFDQIRRGKGDNLD